MGLKLNRCPKVSASTGIRVMPPEETLKRVLPLLEKAGMDPIAFRKVNCSSPVADEKS